MRKCHSCDALLPDDARFCLNCGARQEQVYQQKEPEVKKDEPLYQLNFKGDLQQQITDAFFQALRQRVEEEHNPSLQKEYVEQLYQSGFRDTVDRRSQQLAAEATQIFMTQTDADKKINRLLEYNFSDLLDYFIIHFCKDLNGFPLSEAILKYQHIQKRDQLDLFQMVLDYLDFAHENETVYTDFINMPLSKLKNAGKQFMFPEKDERILLICDQTLFGSCKEGFAITEAGIYWKAHLEPARKVLFKDLKEVAREKDWLNINGWFFNVSPSLNIKILKLLKKLKRMR